MDPAPDAQFLSQLRKRLRYQGSPKHKRNPQTFGLPAFSGARGDATLCEHAAFSAGDSGRIPFIMGRGVQAGLIGNCFEHGFEHGLPKTIWAVDQTGWIFEGKLTNITSGEYHGYPLLPGAPIARLIYDRFRDWVVNHPKPRNQQALENCHDLYGL